LLEKIAIAVSVAAIVLALFNAWKFSRSQYPPPQNVNPISDIKNANGAKYERFNPEQYLQNPENQNIPLMKSQEPRRTLTAEKTMEPALLIKRLFNLMPPAWTLIYPKL